MGNFAHLDVQLEVCVWIMKWQPHFMGALLKGLNTHQNGWICLEETLSVQTYNNNAPGWCVTI